MEVDKDHIHLLVDYSPNVSVAQIVRLLKQMTTSAVWFSHSDELRKHFWKQKVFWSSGYFVCSTGDASTETIAKYIAEQIIDLFAYIRTTKDRAVLRSKNKIK